MLALQFKIFEGFFFFKIVVFVFNRKDGWKILANNKIRPK